MHNSTAAHALGAVLVLGVAFGPTKHTEKPQVAASRLSSFHSQTRTGTVIGRPTNQEPIPFPASGPHSPSKVGNARTADASTASNVPCPPQEESHSGNLSGRLTSPGLGNLSVCSNLPGEFPYSTRVDTHVRRCSCEPFKDTKKEPESQRSNEVGKELRRQPIGAPPG
jgi:hypothetical protein